jgi:glycosyltransferase involved in cell wall biosynthesis
MQEIKKKKIVIASVLKPVDDTRMFGKIGRSLAHAHRFDLHVLGYPTVKKIETPGIALHTSNSFKRISLSRIIQPFRIFNTILQIRPHLIIITTHELLTVSVLIKLLTGCKVVYDVQENYYKNILYTNAFPGWIRLCVALYVRAKELLLSPFINYFILAEQCYKEEIAFAQNKNIILENKLEKPVKLCPKKSKSDGLIHLVFSGTLADTTGVFSAVALAKNLHLQDARIRLTIIGFCPKESTYKKIKNEIRDVEFIELIGGNEIVSHNEIIKNIQECDFGIIAYPSNKATEGRIPTKLYEYLGCALPIVLINDPAWIGLCEPYEACISVDFEKLHIPSILQAMNTKVFYTSPPRLVFWESKELINLMNRLL